MRKTLEKSPFLNSLPSSLITIFNLPAKYHPSALYFGANFSPSFRLTCSIPSSSHDHCNLQSRERRRLILLSLTVPFLNIQEYTNDFYAEAQELEADQHQIIRDEVRKVLSKGKAAGILRLVFHDAGTFESNNRTGGINGSIAYELERPENKGLKKSLKILEKAKNVVDMRESVSWADLIAVAGAEAVSICGGPLIPVRTPDPEGQLPEESLDAPRLKQCFKRKGFSTQELVALSGAHTIGSKGFGSPTEFDNSYYKILLERPWVSAGEITGMVGLPTDRALVEDDECLSWIRKYANDQDLFFEDFKNAYIKLVDSGARWKAS